MSCTCFAKKYPCPIHGDKPIPPPEIVTRDTYVIHLLQRWGGNEKWFYSLTKDAIQISVGSDRENKHDALLECICKLTNLNEENK